MSHKILRFAGHLRFIHSIRFDSILTGGIGTMTVSMDAAIFY